MTSFGIHSSRSGAHISRGVIPCIWSGIPIVQSLARVPCGRWYHGTRCPKTTPKASSEKKTDSTLDINEKWEELSKDLSDRWEATEEKPVAIAIAIGTLVGLYALNGIVGSVEKIPIFGFLFEVVGILVTGWFAYRYLVFESDRDELKENLDEFLGKISGK